MKENSLGTVMVKVILVAMIFSQIKSCGRFGTNATLFGLGDAEQARRIKDRQQLQHMEEMRQREDIRSRNACPPLFHERGFC